MHQCSTKPLTLEAQKSLILDTGCIKVDELTGHNMLVEVQRTTDSSYHVRQFNSGNGIENHVTWRVSTSGSEDRYLSFVDMPALVKTKSNKLDTIMRPVQTVKTLSKNYTKTNT